MGSSDIVHTLEEHQQSLCIQNQLLTAIAAQLADIAAQLSGLLEQSPQPDAAAAGRREQPPEP
jgi:hypothetical protein